LVNPILAELSTRFHAMYAPMGRPSIPPEPTLRALLLQTLYTIQSGRQLIEQIDYNLLFRWIVGLNLDDAVWIPAVFTKNRDRLIGGTIADAFLNEILKAAGARERLSPEHFTVDGTLLEAWASHKSFWSTDDPTSPPSDGDPKYPTVNFRKETRSNTTHESMTYPDRRLARKSQRTAALLGHLGNVLMDNRHGLIVATDVRPPSGMAEGEAGVEMLTTLAARRPSHARRQRARLSGESACESKYPWAPTTECDRWPHDPTPWLRRQPAQTQARRRKLRPGRNDWGLAQTTSTRPGES
ncbi:MAG: transposase, partial [Acidobacteriota bacterium]|nr:transposase [Acidobacteriota bacterium]